MKDRPKRLTDLTLANIWRAGEFLEQEAAGHLGDRSIDRWKQPTSICLPNFWWLVGKRKLSDHGWMSGLVELLVNIARYIPHRRERSFSSIPHGRRKRTRSGSNSRRARHASRPDTVVGGSLDLQLARHGLAAQNQKGLYYFQTEHPTKQFKLNAIIWTGIVHLFR